MKEQETTYSQTHFDLLASIPYVQNISPIGLNYLNKMEKSESRILLDSRSYCLKARFGHEVLHCIFNVGQKTFFSQALFLSHVLSPFDQILNKKVLNSTMLGPTLK